MQKKSAQQKLKTISTSPISSNANNTLCTATGVTMI